MKANLKEEVTKYAANWLEVDPSNLLITKQRCSMKSYINYTVKIKDYPLLFTVYYADNECKEIVPHTDIIKRNSLQGKVLAAIAQHFMGKDCTLFKEIDHNSYTPIRGKLIKKYYKITRLVHQNEGYYLHEYCKNLNDDDLYYLTYNIDNDEYLCPKISC